MSGLLMASIMRYRGFEQLWWPPSRMQAQWSSQMLYNNGIVWAALWAPIAVCLALLASSRYRSSTGHVASWWWIVVGRVGVIVMNAWILANESNVTVLGANVWWQYVLVGFWFGIGGWIPALAYVFVSADYIAKSLEHLMVLITSTRVLMDLKYVAAATSMYFGAMAAFHALENWRDAYKVWLGVGALLCTFSVALSMHREWLQDHTRGIMHADDFTVLTNAIHLESMLVAAGTFVASFVGRLIDKATQ